MTLATVLRIGLASSEHEPPEVPGTQARSGLAKPLAGAGGAEYLGACLISASAIFWGINRERVL